VVFCSVPPVLTLCFVNNLDDCVEKNQSFGSFGEGLLRAVLRTVAVNCPKRVVDFLEGPVNLIKMNLSLSHCKFLTAFVSHTGNCFGDALQFETLDQNGQNC